MNNKWKHLTAGVLLLAVLTMSGCSALSRVTGTEQTETLVLRLATDLAQAGPG